MVLQVHTSCKFFTNADYASKKITITSPVFGHNNGVKHTKMGEHTQTVVQQSKTLKKLQLLPFQVQYVYKVFASDIYSEASWQLLALLPISEIILHLSVVTIFISNHMKKRKREKETNM